MKHCGRQGDCTSTCNSDTMVKSSGSLMIRVSNTCLILLINLVKFLPITILSTCENSFDVVNGMYGML